MVGQGKGKGSLSTLLASVPAGIPDEELDNYVADLILKRSKERTEEYERTGISAFLTDAPGPSRAAAANKTFLASVIRNVQGHNESLSRQPCSTAQRQRPRPSRDAGEGSTSGTKCTSETVQGSYSSKMDKYFSKDYDPARDISIDDVTDESTGLIHAGTSGTAFDRLLTTLTPRADSEKEAKRKRKEERDLIRARRKEARELDHRPKRSRSRSPISRSRAAKDKSRSHRSTADERGRKHRPSTNTHPPPSPSSIRKTREWDLGKRS